MIAPRVACPFSTAFASTASKCGGWYIRQSSGVSSARDGMVKDQAGSTTIPIVFGRAMLLATQALEI